MPKNKDFPPENKTEDKKKTLEINKGDKEKTEEPEEKETIKKLFNLKEEKIQGVKKEIEVLSTKELEENLDKTRDEYIAYEKFLKQKRVGIAIEKTKKKASNVFKKLFKNKEAKELFEDKYAAEKKEVKDKYTKARIEMGEFMYEQKKAELVKEGLSGEELEKALTEYRASEILAKVILEERQKVIEGKVENPNLFKKLLQSYANLKPRWKKVALSTALFTLAAGTGVVSGGALAGYGLATMAAVKFGKSMTIGYLTTFTGKGIDKLKKKSDDKFVQNQYDKKMNLQEKFSKNEIDVEEYEKKINLIEKEEYKRNRNRMLVKAGAGILISGSAGFLTSGLLMGHAGGETHITGGKSIGVENKPIVSVENLDTNKASGGVGKIFSEKLSNDSTKVELDSAVTAKSADLETENMKPLKLEDLAYRKYLKEVTGQQYDEHNIPSDNVTTNENISISKKDIVNKENIPITENNAIENPSSVTISAEKGDGGIFLARHLQKELRVKYPDINKAPDGVKEALKLKDYELAKKWGLYKPNETAESAVVKVGDKINFDEKTGIATITNKEGTAELNENYNGKMFDYQPKVKVEEPVVAEEEYIPDYENVAGEDYFDRINYDLDNTTPRFDPQADIENVNGLNQIRFNNDENVLVAVHGDKNIYLKFEYDDGKVTNLKIRRPFVGEQEAQDYFKGEAKSYIKKLKFNKLDETEKIEIEKRVGEIVSSKKMLEQLPHDSEEYKLFESQLEKTKDHVMKDYENVLKNRKFDKLKIHGSDKEKMAIANPHDGYLRQPLNEVEVEQLKTFSRENINHIFNTEEKMKVWNKVKGTSAKNMLKLEEADINADNRPLFKYMRELKRVGGLKPKVAGSNTPPESISDYINRSLKKIAEMGQLGEVRRENY